MKKILTSQQATERFGATLANQLRPGDVVILEGHIGSGKTTLVRGIAKGLGIHHPITSPTFVVRKDYVVRKNPAGISALHHMDAYRLHTVRELRGVLDALVQEHANAVWCIEWGSRIRTGFDGVTTWRVHLTTLTTTSRTVFVTRLPAV